MSTLAILRAEAPSSLVVPKISIVRLGENTAEAARQAGLAEGHADAAAASEASAAMAAASATAIGRYFSSKAAGEAGSTTGQFFSYPDGSGGLIYAEKTSGGSVEIGRAATIAGLIPAVATTAAITSGVFDASITRIQTRGFAAANDGGAAVYERTTASLSGGSGVWWFTAADASKWQIVKLDEHRAAQFGALGGAGINATPILNAALASDQVQVVNLGPLTHYINGATTGSYTILKPSGKGLRGINREVSWVKLNAVTLGTQANAIQTIYCEDDEHGFFEDFSLDCQRSGAGGTNNDRVSGVTIRAKSADGRGTRVRRVNVYNATGYGHYESADATRKLRDIVREDCQSWNCQVGHESSGDVEVLSIDPYTHSDSGNVWDGGASISCEAMFHEYGNVLKVHRVRAKGYGHCGAGIYPSPIAGSANLRSVIYDDPDIEVLSAVPGLQTDGSGSYSIESLKVNGGRIVSKGTGANFTYAAAQVYGTKIVGGQGGSGAGVISTTGATVDLYAPDVTGTGSGGVAAIGVSQQGTGVMRWHGGGKLTATGGSAQNATDGTVTFVGNGPIASPAIATLGTHLPGYRQRVRGTKAPGDWGLYTDGTARFNFVNINLGSAVSSRALTDVNLTMQTSDGDLTLMPNDLGVRISWQSDSQIQVQIPPGVTTTNLTLRYSIIEWVS